MATIIIRHSAPCLFAKAVKKIRGSIVPGLFQLFLKDFNLNSLKNKPLGIATKSATCCS
jgi:hypothetical protein